MTFRQRLIFLLAVVTATAICAALVRGALWIAQALIKLSPLGRIAGFFIMLGIVGGCLFLYGVWGTIAFWVIRYFEPNTKIPWQD
jgi:hypothetical protein